MIRNGIWALAALAALATAAPARANLVTEPTFAQLMTEAQLVVIGTVTASDYDRRRRSGSTATLSVIHTLKGEATGPVTVSTASAVAELNPRCCEVGATYLMFLRPSARDGRLVSVWGLYGMIRVGGPPGRGVVVCPTGVVSRCPRLPDD